MGNDEIKVGDIVKHDGDALKMTVTSLGDFSGQGMAYCEWSDADDYPRGSLFPVAELSTIAQAGSGLAALTGLFGEERNAP